MENKKKLVPEIMKEKRNSRINRQRLYTHSKKATKIEDILSAKDIAQIKMYERKVKESASPLGVYLNQRKAMQVIIQAEKRYTESRKSGPMQSGEKL